MDHVLTTEKNTVLFLENERRKFLIFSYFFSKNSRISFPKNSGNFQRIVVLFLENDGNLLFGKTVEFFSVDFQKKSDFFCHSHLYHRT